MTIGKSATIWIKDERMHIWLGSDARRSRNMLDDTAHYIKDHHKTNISTHALTEGLCTRFSRLRSANTLIDSIIKQARAGRDAPRGGRPSSGSGVL